MPEVSFVSDLFAIDIVGPYYGVNSTMFYLLITRRPLNLEVLLSSCDSGSWSIRLSYRPVIDIFD